MKACLGGTAGLIGLLLLQGCVGNRLAPVVETSVDSSVPAAESSAVAQAAPGPSSTVENDDVIVTALGDDQLSATTLAPSENAVSASDTTVAAPGTHKELNPAVIALLNRANTDSQAGRHADAAVNLERALKIAPDDPWLWHLLARSRLRLGEHDLAQNLAARSNSFAGADRTLLADNWHLIAEARRLSGDATGAQAAQIRAQGFSDS